MKKLSLALSALACAVLMFTGCQKDLSTSAEITAAKIVLTPAVAATETEPEVPEVALEGVINSDAATIGFVAKMGTDISALVPTFTLAEGATSDYDGTTAVNFNQPFTVTVTAEDGTTTKAWTVTVDNSGFVPSSEKAIEKFSAFGVPGTIDEEAKTIKLVLPQNTNLSAVIPEIEISKYAKVSPASGESVNFKFISTKVYTVTAEDGTTAEYTVEVTAPHSDCDIETFSIGVGKTEIVESDEGNKITITLPNGRAGGKFTPEITISEGATVSPASGVEQDFTNPVDYTVTAENGSTKVYKVTVVSVAAPDAVIISASVLIGNNPLIIDNTATDNGTIDYGKKTIVFEYTGTGDLTALTPVLVLTEGATYTPKDEPKDFSENKEVIYTITSENGATEKWSMKIVDPTF